MVLLLRLRELQLDSGGSVSFLQTTGWMFIVGCIYIIFLDPVETCRNADCTNEACYNEEPWMPLFLLRDLQ